MPDPGEVITAFCTLVSEYSSLPLAPRAPVSRIKHVGILDVHGNRSPCCIALACLPVPLASLETRH